MYIESSSNMGIMGIQPMMIIHYSLVKMGLDEKVCRELVAISRYVGLENSEWTNQLLLEPPGND